jgi:hypothetical protein
MSKGPVSTYQLLRSGIWALLLMPFALLQTANAQETIISGKVTDAGTGEALPFVTIVLKGTQVATLSDFEGNYLLKTKIRADSLAATFVGYQGRVKPVKPGITQVINFQLAPQNYDLLDVVVTPGINPALKYIKNAREKRESNNMTSLSSYQFESFNKVEIDLDNFSEELKSKRIMKPFARLFDTLTLIAGEDGRAVLPVFISESLSDYYVQKDPQKTKEYIKATKISGIGLEDGTFVSQLLGSSFSQLNLYDNNIRLTDKFFVSPIADGSTNFYVFTLVDSATIDNHWCYQIQIDPKRPADLCFTGNIWISDTSFALKRVVLEVKKSANLNFIDRIKIQQDFERTTAGPWLPIKTRLVVEITQVSKRATGMIAKFYSSNRNIKVNVQYHPKFFDNPIEVAPDAQQKDEEFWVQHRHEQLTQQEVSVFEMVSQINHMPVVKTYVDMAKVIIDGYKKAGKIDIGPYAFLYSYNAVEEHRFRLGFRTNISFSKKWILRGHLAYGTGDTRFKYNSQAEYILSRKSWTVLGLQHREDVDQIGITDNNYGASNLFTSISLFGANRLNNTKETKFWLETNTIKGLTARVKLHHKTFTPLGEFSFAYYTDPANPHTSPLRKDITSSSVSLEADYVHKEIILQNDNERIRNYSTFKFPRIIFSYTAGFKGVLNSDFSYHRLSLNVQQSLNTGILGTARYTIGGNKIFSPLPYPLLEVLRGNQSFIYSSAAYNLMNFFEFVSDATVMASYEQHMEGLITNRLPAIKKLKLRVFVTGKAVYGSLSQANLNLIPEEYRIFNSFSKGKPYAEVGYGVENIFKLLRVDFIHRVTYLSNPGIKRFGVKLSVQFTF